MVLRICGISFLQAKTSLPCLAIAKWGRWPGRAGSEGVKSPPSVGCRRQPPAGGPVAALTVHRTVIHSRDCASLTPIPCGTGEPLNMLFRICVYLPKICSARVGLRSRSMALWTSRSCWYQSGAERLSMPLVSQVQAGSRASRNLAANCLSRPKARA